MRRPLLLMLALLTLAGAAVGAILEPLPAREPGSLLIGAVADVIGTESFTLVDGTLVVTDPSTVFTGVTGAADLRPGDLVQAAGTWDHGGGIFHASVVDLLQGPAPPTGLTGEIAFLMPPDGLSLADGTLAQVHPGTVYVNVSGYDELAPGDQVSLSGELDTWTQSLRVDWLEVLGSSVGGYTAFYGTVARTEPPDRIVLDDGSAVVVSAMTLFDGFVSLDELAPGDLLWIEATPTSDPNVFDALLISLQAASWAPVRFQATVSTVDPAASNFSTSEGQLVWVDAGTTFSGLAGLSELLPGDLVLVEGTSTSSPWEVQASLVQLVERGGDGVGGYGLASGFVGTIQALLPPTGIVLDNGQTITTDAFTAWLGMLSGYSDLEVGMTVQIEGRWTPDGAVVAVSVELLSRPENGIVSLSGVVTEAQTGTGRFLLSSGEWILLDSQTVLDGDVDAIAEITAGMLLTADCVQQPGGDYWALWVIIGTGQLDIDAPWASPEGFSASEALVVLDQGAVAAEVAERHGATVAGRLPGTLVHLFVWPGPVDEALIRVLAEDPEVEDVEPNFNFQDPESVRRRQIAVDRYPSSAKYSQQSAVEATGLLNAHSRSQGRGAVVAVIDTGVDPFHPLLRHRIEPGGFDYVDNDPRPWEVSDGLNQDGDEDIDEAAGHGTFVSGLVLLAAPAATILPYRVLDDEGHGTTFAICQAVLAAIDRGADVINMSFVFQERSRVLDRLLDEASHRGVVLVSGAGNDSQGDELPFPARDHRVLAVAAVDDAGELADFSNFGPQVAIAAPGVAVYSGGCRQQFGTWSGTSMAAPLVSGAVALLRSVNGRLSPEQVAAALAQSAVPLAGDPQGVPGALRVDRALALVPNAP